MSSEITGKYLDAAYQDCRDARRVIREIISTLADDALCATFQTIGQYRSAVIKHIGELVESLAKTRAERTDALTERGK